MKAPDDKLLTVRQVSLLIGFSTSTIYAGNCDTHLLPKIEIWDDRRARPAIRYSYLDVMEWIANHRARAKTRQRLRKAPKIHYRKPKPHAVQSKLKLVKR
ncbi:MAG: helix-turn-helix transcriptional regulator [Blastocatellia bacterium]